MACPCSHVRPAPPRGTGPSPLASQSHAETAQTASCACAQLQTHQAPLGAEPPSGSVLDSGYVTAPHRALPSSLAGATQEPHKPLSSEVGLATKPQIHGPNRPATMSDAAPGAIASSSWISSWPTDTHTCHRESFWVPEEVKHFHDSTLSPMLCPHGTTFFPAPPGEVLLQDSAPGTSLVAQWLRIRLPVRGTRVRTLVREHPTCRGATKPVRHNY
ncbi:hypothetical protein J1605_010430 [Eschrichtius robustus]|uniref:Uncharacterized protein n=1 Tax=Eschrichtius robustus TaxID=9764 RepID=A0AB34GUE4_ESCRO|nr:hypothetical protein J1605_010430 [Eschrichtius robustus]